jgi:rhomboid family protein
MAFLFVFILTVLIALLQMSFLFPLPFSDTGTVRYRSIPWMTFTLIIVNALVFIIWQAPDYYRAQTLRQLQPYVNKVWLYGYRGIFMREGQSIGAFTTFTSMFMHAEFFHLFGNMIFLWAFGPEIEEAMGSLHYLTFYLSGGFVAGLCQIAATPHSTVPSLGASGAIAAVMGAFLVTYPGDKIKSVMFFGIFFRVTFIPAALLIGFWFLTQLVNLGAVASVTEMSKTGGVAYLAHVGGLIFGAVTARLFEIWGAV